jgi:two-component system, response regulator YesN
MYTVMIVDESAIARKQIKRMKPWGGATGFMIHDEATDGYEALTKLQRSPADLIMASVSLPVISGIELLQKVRVLYPDSYVVLLSDSEDFGYARQGFLEGALDFLTKPLEENELVKLLARADSLIRKAGKSSLPALSATSFFMADTAELIRQISRLIREGDLLFPDAAEQAAERISMLEDDVWAAFMLKRLIWETVHEAFLHYKWLHMFIDVKKLTEPYLSGSDDLTDLKQAYSNAVRTIAALLVKLRCNHSGSLPVQRICGYVLKHTDRNISVGLIAEALFMNKTYVSEVFKLKTGMALTGYLTLVKMERAKLLLSGDRLKVYEISDRLGFKDTEYFSRVFKKYTGMTPSRFRQNMT